MLSRETGAFSTYESICKGLSRHRETLRSFAKIYTTPNVLTEVSNLGKKGGVDFFSQLKSVIEVLDERSCSSSTAAQGAYFDKLGLTDSALLKLGPEFLIVTADFTLHSILRANKVNAVNFNHLRPHLLF